MLHSNDLHNLPDGVFRDMKSLQVKKKRKKKKEKEQQLQGWPIIYGWDTALKPMLAPSKPKEHTDHYMTFPSPLDFFKFYH